MIKVFLFISLIAISNFVNGQTDSILIKNSGSWTPSDTFCGKMLIITLNNGSQIVFLIKSQIDTPRIEDLDSYTLDTGFEGLIMEDSSILKEIYQNNRMLRNYCFSEDSESAYKNIIYSFISICMIELEDRVLFLDSAEETIHFKCVEIIPEKEIKLPYKFKYVLLYRRE